MFDRMLASMVRIRHTESKAICGAGFMVNPQTIFTCAHVVNAALGLPSDAPDIPESVIDFDLPYLPETGLLSGRVVAWKSCQETPGDIAVLQTEKPIEVAYPHLVIPERTWHHAVRGMGFPQGHPDGILITGVLLHRLANRMLQIQAESEIGHFVEWGFSGSPLWDDELQGIIGMVVRMDTELARRVAFVIPTDSLIEIYPALKEMMEQDEQRQFQRRFFAVRKHWIEWQAAKKEMLFRTPFNTQGIESPLVEEWETFIKKRSWHEDIAEKIDNLIKDVENSPEFVDFARTLQAIDTEVNYKSIQGLLRKPANDKQLRPDIFKEIAHLQKITKTTCENLRSGYYPITTPEEQQLQQLCNAPRDLNELQEMVNTPRFKRCFLVTGGMGSGKSHFLATLLEETALPDEIGIYNEDTPLPLDFYLPLEMSEKSLADALLDAICAASGMAWENLEAFDGFLQQYRQFFPRQTSRLVVMIDDLSRFARRHENFIRDLIRFIQEHTYLHSFYWVVTVPLSFYAELDKHSSNEFWLEYSAVDASPGRFNLQDEQETATRIGGWIALDALNELEEVGLDLLRLNLATEDEYVELAIENTSNEAILRQFCNPFIACVLLSLKDALPLASAIDLAFIDFVQRFWEGQVRSLRQKNSQISAADLHLFVKLTAHFLSEGGSFFPQKNDLLARITADAKGKLDANAVLDVLKDSFLIKLERAEEIPSLFDDIQDEKLELCFDAFWQFLLADELSHHPELPGLQTQAESTALQKWLEARAQSLREEQIQAGLWEFFVLMQDRKKETQQFASRVCSVMLRSNKLPQQAVWLAGPKASLFIQRILFEQARNLKGRHLKPPALFALIYFAGDVASEIARVPVRLKVIQPFYEQISRTAYVSYFRYTAERLMDRVTTPEDALQVMNYLSDCEILSEKDANITQYMAWLTVRMLYRVTDEDFDEMAKLILRYLSLVSSEYVRFEDVPHQDEGWHRYLYREWVMNVFIYCLSHDQLKDAYPHRYREAGEIYQFLKQHHWYDYGPARKNFCLQRQMEQEANIGLGQLYRWRYSETYLPFIESLLNSEEWQDRNNAFHIIRHTEPTAGLEDEAVVDACFVPYLKQITDDSSLAKTVKTFSRFFNINLKPRRL